MNSPRPGHATIVALAILAGSMAARAQQSSSYVLSEHDLNEGGQPAGGVVPTSASFKLSLDAIGGALRVTEASSTSYRMNAGFVVAYRPPGEVLDLTWSGKTTLVWSPERSVGVYNVYRGTVSGLPGGYGSCLASNLTSATATDADIPAPGECFFYLVTAENRIGEEGTKGYDTHGTERPNPAPCP